VTKVIFIPAPGPLPPLHPLPVVQLAVPVTALPPIARSPNACQQLVGATETVEWIRNHIMQFSAVATDNYLRKTLILISRCPRGGKTTILEMLHRSLQSRHMHVMIVSFNGVSGFLRLTDETPSESLFRLITNQLDLTIDKQSPRVTDWDRLDAHIGDEPFVLMIDELNVLCNTVDSELARVLKTYFLDKASRHLVATSHQPFVAENVGAGGENAGHGATGCIHKLWSDSMAALSERSLTLVPMPVSCDVSRLKRMNTVRCSMITHSVAAFYGFIPSLMYAVCVQSEESPCIKFGMVVKGASTDIAQLLDFVLALISGIPAPSLRQFFCFSSAVEFNDPLGVRMKWPLCYVACILRHFPGRALFEYIAKCIDTLGRDCETLGDGMAWEQSVRIAILLKFVAAVNRGWDLPFKLCRADEAAGADIEVINLGENVFTVDEVKRVIDDHKARFHRNTLVLFVPTEAKLQQFDGFCVRYQDGELRSVCGYQCKDSNRGADVLVPAWITQGGHLLRSDAPKRCREVTQNSKRWTYYNAEDTDDFLGWSLRMMPG
jgi:hypothetical protein